MSDRGTYRQYGPTKKLNESTLKMIGYCNKIIDEFESQGYSVSVRQIYYQMVARGYTGGENTPKMYSRIQAALNEGRMQGLVSWSALEDRGRNLRGLNTYETPYEVFAAAKNDYRLDLWKDQEWRPEVWIEKDALSGVISGICN